VRNEQLRPLFTYDVRLSCLNGTTGSPVLNVLSGVDWNRQSLSLAPEFTCVVRAVRNRYVTASGGKRNRIGIRGRSRSGWCARHVPLEKSVDYISVGSATTT
jgi:hypothetical protein